MIGNLFGNPEQVSNYYQQFKVYSTPEIMKLRRQIEPTGFWGFYSFLKDQDRLDQSAAIEKILIERGKITDSSTPSPQSASSNP